MPPIEVARDTGQTGAPQRPAMRITAQIEESRIPLGNAGQGAGAYDTEWIEQKVNSLQPADDEDDLSLEAFATIRRLALKEIDSCKAVREWLS
jgi:hypothetical protein